jgi:formylglycine-generating enzyme required for sulfatase activity
MKTIVAVMLVAVALFHAPHAYADTFGSGANQFDIEFVTIGDPGNLPVTLASVGSVPYVYRMGKYEVSRDMITKANIEGGLGITLDPMSFVTGGVRAAMPATGISWFEAAKFVNWLNTSAGHTPAYKFNGDTFEWWQPGDAGYDPNNPYRNRQAIYVLPSEHEWVKAAHYDPTSDVYYIYPTGSDTPPTPVVSGTAPGTVVYGQSWEQGPADITAAGGLSRYGTMAQGGNVWEWTERDLYGSEGDYRVLRGGSWNDFIFELLTAEPFGWDVPNFEFPSYGFRVASIPEPSTLWLAITAMMFVGWRRLACRS